MRFFFGTPDVTVTAEREGSPPRVYLPPKSQPVARSVVRVTTPPSNSNWKILKRKILHNYPFSGNTISKTKKKVEGVI